MGISSPHWNFFSSRMSLYILMRLMASRSCTPLASGWLPKLMWSPVRQRMFLMPSVLAPMMSACMARRLRSRQVICMIASRPFCWAV